MAFTPLTSKDPSDVADYELTIEGPGLGDDTLASVTATGTGVTVDSSSFTLPATVTVWLSGGTAGSDALVKLACTTTGGRTIERTFALPIRDL